MARNITICQFKFIPDPDTASSEVERSILEDVFPAAGDRPRQADELFICSLYRSDRRTGSTYLCLVESLFPSDRDFYGMRGPLTALGASLSLPPRYWPMCASVPDADTAAEAARTAPELRMTILRLGFDRDQAKFEQVLAQALVTEAEPARANIITTARWFRDDDTALGAVEYLYTATGVALCSSPRPGVTKSLQETGAEVAHSDLYLRVGSLAGGGFRGNA
jgi:hypothetical protein